MALSEYEQRVLKEMEAQLRANDPKLAQQMGSARGGLDVRRISLGILAFMIGLGGLIGGVATSQIWLGVLGFIVMLGGVLYGMSSGNRGRTIKGVAKPKPKAPTSGSSSFMDKQAQRWDNRKDQSGR